MSKRANSARPQPAVPLANPWLAAFLAWVIPGLGHLFLGLRRRALIFCLLVLGSFVLGCLLHGALPWNLGGSPLQKLHTLGTLGAGSLYLVTVFALAYSGDVQSAGYEYGSAFILTAGLMNLLLMLDAWDIAWGKELQGDSEEAERS